MSEKLRNLIRNARKLNASDIHIVVGLPSVLRVEGEVVAARGEIVTETAARELVCSFLNDEQKRVLESTWQLCLSTCFGENERARVTIYMRNGVPEMSIRLSEPVIRSREDLHLPAILDDLVRKPNGLIILTGPTGVGKTTTFHYMIDRINSERRVKIITIEDPVEFSHACKRAVVVQQEVLTDVKSYHTALMHVLRQDPDVICIGEMRDQETMYTALTASETGHLVIATLHTPDAVQAMQRVISAFPEGRQNEIRYMLANTIQAVIAQQLLPSVSGGRRVLCCEVMVGTAAVRHNIRENSIHKIYSELQAGRKYGMVTMDHALLDLYQRGEIAYDTAVTMARDPNTIKQRVA